MSYKITENTEFTLVQLTGTVSALDLLKSHEEPHFVKAVKVIPSVIYDYSGADCVEMTEETTAHFAELANCVAEYHRQLFIIVVPMDPNNTSRVKRYRSTVTAPNVKVEMAVDLTQAKQLAHAFLKTSQADEH